MITRHTNDPEVAEQLQRLDARRREIAQALAADGLIGADEAEIRVDGRHHREVAIAAAIVPGEGYTNTVTGETFDGMADNYSISAMYSNNGLKLAVGYEVLDQGISGTAGDIVCATATLATDCTNLMVGAGYSMNGFDVSGVYIMQDYGVLEMDIAALSASYTFGNNKVIATIGQSDLDVPLLGVSESETGYGVALQHMFSKRTSAYAAYRNSSANLLGNYGTDEEGVSLGMIHKF